MSSYDTNALALFFLTGIDCFLLGALYQQELSLRCLMRPMQKDIFEARDRIFSAISLFGDETIDYYSFNLFKGTKDHWLRKQLYNLIPFVFFASPDDSEGTKKFKIIQTQLWDIMKYGFPGLDDIKSQAWPVYSGPLYMPRRLKFRKWAVCYNIIGLNNVAVPTHFFKVIIFESKYLKDLPYMEGYVIANADIKIEKGNSLSSFLCNINDIEHFSGLKFYDGLIEKKRGLQWNKFG